MRPSLAIVAGLLACSKSPSATPSSNVASNAPAIAVRDASAPPATGTLALRLTPKVAAACGPDYLERHATSLSDLDGDGVLDRPSIVRTADAIVVTLHAIPSLQAKGSWKLLPANAYLEVATPQRRGEHRGDLWITTGHETAPSKWKHSLHRLGPNGLQEITSDYEQWTMRVDVDGDGRVDPIGISSTLLGPKHPVRALLANDKYFDLPVASPSLVIGAPTLHDQQEAIDLDGNGTRELVLEYDDAVAIVEVPSLREVWRMRGKPYDAKLVKWSNTWILAVRLDERLRLFATDRTHAELAAPADLESYNAVVGVIGDRLALSGVPWKYFDRGAPNSVAESGPLLPRIDTAITAADHFGPTKLLASDPPSLATLGKAGEPLALALLDPRSFAVGRSPWKSDDHRSRIEHDVHAWLADLNRDGASEVILEDVYRKAFHHGSSWNTMKLQILDGAGTQLWAEVDARTDSWSHADGARGRMTRTRRDDTHVRAFDLGDATAMPLRIRSALDEYYILPATSKLTSIPVCLE